MNKIRALIVDDELNACLNVESYIHKFYANDIEIVGFAHDIKSTKEYIKVRKPDLVFFDISLGEEN
jgi:DNA-binding LytR/AlgR family response regulator